MRFTKLEGKEAADMAARIKRIEHPMSIKHRIFNILMWVILMMFPVTIFLIAGGFQAVVTKGYWPYKAWVERTFPTR